VFLILSLSVYPAYLSRAIGDGCTRLAKWAQSTGLRAGDFTAFEFRTLWTGDAEISNTQRTIFANRTIREQSPACVTIFCDVISVALSTLKGADRLTFSAVIAHRGSIAMKLKTILSNRTENIMHYLVILSIDRSNQ
jgi:hypothetical protein